MRWPTWCVFAGQRSPERMHCRSSKLASFATSRCAARPYSAATSTCARHADIAGHRTTRAAIGTVPSARRCARHAGWQSASGASCRRTTSTSSSHCPAVTASSALAAGNVHGRLECARYSRAVRWWRRQALARPRTRGARSCLRLTGLDMTVCPVCHEHAVVRRPIAPPAKPEVSDTS
jgi:hypothetical protein